MANLFCREGFFFSGCPGSPPGHTRLYQVLLKKVLVPFNRSSLHIPGFKTIGRIRSWDFIYGKITGFPAFTLITSKGDPDI